jgi:hypothetical protein
VEKEGVIFFLIFCLENIHTYIEVTRTVCGAQTNYREKKKRKGGQRLIPNVQYANYRN